MRSIFSHGTWGLRILMGHVLTPVLKRKRLTAPSSPPNTGLFHIFIQKNQVQAKTSLLCIYSQVCNFHLFLFFAIFVGFFSLVSQEVRTAGIAAKGARASLGWVSKGLWPKRQLGSTPSLLAMSAGPVTARCQEADKLCTFCRKEAKWGSVDLFACGLEAS